MGGSPKGKGMSSMGSNGMGMGKGKGMSMSMKGMKKSYQMEHNLPKYDKIMSCKGNSGKGMRMGSMGKGMGSSKMGSMKMGRYPDDDFFGFDDEYWGKGKGRSMMGKGKGSSKGKGNGWGSSDDDSDDHYGESTESPTRQGNIGEPTIAPSGPTLQPTRTGGSNTPVPSTVAPTLTPDTPLEETTEPTQPVVASCETSAGIYGSTQSTPLTVSYGYELETTPLSIPELQNDVIPPLEIAFNNFLLPNLFPGVCGQVSARRRRLAVRGISTVPADVPIVTVPCQTPKKDTANDCVFVRGRLMLYTDESGPREGYTNTVRNGLEFGMSNDAFVDAHNSIVKVTFVETDINGFPADYTPTPSPEDEDPLSDDETRAIDVQGADDDDRELLLPLLLVAGAVLIVVTGIVTYRNT